MTDVTIILSTYNRPDSLAAVIRSVLLQEFSDWELLVIGDHCTEETGNTVAAFDDPRIQYINLSQRCGEQAIPNAIGMHLAETPFIAFLNHDDIWFPEHLSLALKTLSQSGHDFYTSRTALPEYCMDHASGYRFASVSAKKRCLRDAFAGSPLLFEPASSWVITQNALRKAGPWCSAREHYRTPLSHWILQAWRNDVRHIDSEVVTLIANRLRKPPTRARPLYQQPSWALELWVEMIESERLDELKQRIRNEAMTEAHAPGQPVNYGPNPELSDLANRLLTQQAADAFLESGIDAMATACEQLGLSKGWRLEKPLQRRTGEALPPKPDFAALLADAQQQLKTKALAI